MSGRRRSRLEEEEQLVSLHPLLDKISSTAPPLIRRSLSFSNDTTTKSPMHLTGEICPMITRLHVATKQGQDSTNQRRQRQRSKSVGTHYDQEETNSINFDTYDDEEEEASPLILTPTLSENPSLSQDETESPFPEIHTPAIISIMYGLINAVIVLPVLMSFGSIIYRDEAFAPYLPVLIKLTVVSGMVHQLCFSTFSTLPFAVGQVQDAGLIFLSSIASDLVHSLSSRGCSIEEVLATVTIGLGLATALLGLGLVVMGHCRLAQFVQRLPTCVIGGYLAFIGWFCGMSGLELMAGGGDISPQLLFDNWTYCLPGIVGGLCLYGWVRQLQHMAVLPLSIALLLLLFYAVLFASHTTLAEATQAGWIRPSEAPPVWYHTWDYLQLDKVVWSALPAESLTLLSMIFVVALSSSLDVAAIELELKRPLDYNAELTTVGISNVVSGLLGGYTGSYIFSQSIFSLRAGIRSRLAGFVLAFCELVVFVSPAPILSYVPNFFFGSLLIMICIDLMHEWLWHVRDKLSTAEYCICLATFVLIQILGVEYGILAGVILYVVCRKLGFRVGSRSGDGSVSSKLAAGDGEAALSLRLDPMQSYGSVEGHSIE